jgi:hypothetical protein
MTALEVVVLIVAAGTFFYLLLSVTGVLRRPPRVRRGETWIDHPEDQPIEDRPSEDAADEPIPQHHTRLRGRPQTR